MTEKTSKHAVKPKHNRACTAMHNDSEWKPDEDSGDYASSGCERN